ncbi:DNA-binding protein [Vagococcus elongatus]|uniref:DNA-binding protein n=1 Tax=Vagococcus elongatus TaxID=180344 RepID=A0A430AU14_9ENTE|nr:DNA-binding protein [Vagococcus elongatus]RSU11549.1 hypothetical protein CBF29_07660 [Vagococcus elongatus]
MKNNQLSVIEKAVLSMIPHGKNNRKPLKEISAGIDLDTRSIQSIINRLVMVYHIPICALRETGGVYIPLTEEERQEGLKGLKSQASDMNRRIEIVESVDLNKRVMETEREVIS